MKNSYKLERQMDNDANVMEKTEFSLSSRGVFIVFTYLFFFIENERNVHRFMAYRLMCPQCVCEVYLLTIVNKK